MAMNVTLVLKRTYNTGKESGERPESAGRGCFVRAHWFKYAGRTELRVVSRDFSCIILKLESRIVAHRGTCAGTAGPACFLRRGPCG